MSIKYYYYRKIHNYNNNLLIVLSLFLLLSNNIFQDISCESNVELSDVTITLREQQNYDKEKEGLTNHQKYSECTKTKRIEDCLPLLYSTAILAVVTTFLLSLCLAFICCMVCCTARCRSRNERERVQFTGFSLVSNRSSELTEIQSSPTDSLHFCPTRYDPDPPPKYPGIKTLESERIILEEDSPPPPYSPSFKSETYFENQ